jgi:hypothetical protein
MSLAATLRIINGARTWSQRHRVLLLIDLEETLEKAAHVSGDILCHVCNVARSSQQ